MGKVVMAATELRAIDELPDLGLTMPTIFVWDQEPDVVEVDAGG